MHVRVLFICSDHGRLHLPSGELLNERRGRSEPKGGGGGENSCWISTHLPAVPRVPTEGTAIALEFDFYVVGSTLLSVQACSSGM